MWSAGNRTPPRIGRVGTWEELLRRRALARRGTGGITLLESAPGLGKSAFLEAMVGDASAHGFLAVLTRAAPVESPRPFKVIDEALERLKIGRRSEEPEPERRGGSSIAFMPAVGPGESPLGPTDPLMATREGERSELAVDRIRLLTSLAEPILRTARETPLLIALDDLQWADEASVELLLYLQLQLEDAPVWVLGAYDPEKLRPAGRSTQLGRLLRDPDVQRLVLPPLSEPEVGEFVRWLAPHRPLPVEEVRRLYQESRGSPAELTRLITRPAGARSDSKALSAPEDPADQLMLSLEPATRRLLTFAVVNGGEFSVRLLGAATGVGEEKAIELADELQRRGVLQELGGDRFGFTDEALRRRIYGRLLSLRARIIHRTLFETLERTQAHDASSVYALARHAYLGRVDRSAVHYNRQAAALAAGALDFAAARTCLEHALETQLRVAPDDAAAEVALRLDIALLQSRMGEPAVAEAALAYLRAAERLWNAMTPDSRALLSTYEARVRADQGKWEEAARSLDDVPEQTLAHGPPTVAVAALRLRGEILYYQGEYPKALAAHDRARTIALEAGEVREAAVEQIRRAIVLSMIPEREAEAPDEFRAAVTKLLELGDRAEAGYGQLCLGTELAEKGRPEEARRELRKAIEYSTAANDLRRSSWAHLNLADLELRVGLVDSARAELTEAREEFGKIDDPMGLARTYLTQGRLALASADPGTAESSYRAAATIFQAQHLDADELEVELRLAEVELARAEAESARGRLERIAARGLAQLRPDLVGELNRLRDSASRATARA